MYSVRDMTGTSSNIQDMKQVKYSNCIKLNKDNQTCLWSVFPSASYYSSYTSTAMQQPAQTKPQRSLFRLSPQTLAFTLVELLIVLAIIATLVGILLPAINFVRYQSQAADAASTIKSVYLALEQYTTKSSLNLYPDDPPDAANRYVGFLKYDPQNASDPGVLGKLSVKEYFSPTTEALNDDGHMLDPWGDPFIYVKGNFANRIGSASYDPNLPQDTNKPKDPSLAPKESDWNIDDKGGYRYIYSTGASDDPADWIYIKDSKGDY